MKTKWGEGGKVNTKKEGGKGKEGAALNVSTFYIYKKFLYIYYIFI